MRLDDQPESSNIEDRRGSGFGGGPRLVGAGGIGGLGLVAVIVLGLLFGVDPATLLSLVEGNQPASYQQQAQAPRPQQSGAEDSQRRFVAQVLGSTEAVWTNEFAQHGHRYQPPTLVLFSGSVQSACGMAQSATGPFYCPRDQKVYLDTAFFRDMQVKLGAPGDFPRAYVIAHEIGHHVQNLLGLLDTSRSNDASVRTELQADCFAGVWANRANATNHILEQGDIQEGINAAAAIGDDRLQQQSRGYVVPDSFTHGSSAQRVRWFTRGVQSGDIAQCDTQHARQL
ncbi:MAG TPA: neutral zinc metallopeptidase [Acetobacteraceae bacterium]